MSGCFCVFLNIYIIDNSTIYAGIIIYDCSEYTADITFECLRRLEDDQRFLWCFWDCLQHECPNSSLCKFLMFNENFGVFHVAINLDIFFIQMIIFFLHYLVELCLFLSSKNIVVQGEQLYFITNFTYKCALYYQWFKSSCHRNILFLCFSSW